VVVEAGTISVALQEGSIDEGAAWGFVADPKAGGIATFAGVTRSITDGRETIRLSYDAYPEMAEAVLLEIASEAATVNDICRVFVRHRTGIVPAGEASVLIVVSAPHRADAFAACRYIIDELKKRAPIWKKEHFADGRDEWVEGDTPNR